ncbi:MAG TPA: hypothetical protein VFP13_00770, partial [Actinomycetota bacterium]|nr:hypothetical protein [Actinomycetota bacterium]
SVCTTVQPGVAGTVIDTSEAAPTRPITRSDAARSAGVSRPVVAIGDAGSIEHLLRGAYDRPPARGEPRHPSRSYP